MFIIGTVVIMVGIVGYLAFQILVLSKQTQTITMKVAFVGPVSTLVQPFTAGAKTLDYKIVQVSATDEGDAKQQLQQAKVDAVITGELTAPQVFVRDQFPASLQAVLQLD